MRNWILSVALCGLLALPAAVATGAARVLMALDAGGMEAREFPALLTSWRTPVRQDSPFESSYLLCRVKLANGCEARGQPLKGLLLQFEIGL